MFIAPAFQHLVHSPEPRFRFPALDVTVWGSRDGNLPHMVSICVAVSHCSWPLLKLNASGSRARQEMAHCNEFPCGLCQGARSYLLSTCPILSFFPFVAGTVFHYLLTMSIIRNCTSHCNKSSTLDQDLHQNFLIPLPLFFHLLLKTDFTRAFVVLPKQGAPHFHTYSTSCPLF